MRFRVFAFNAEYVKGFEVHGKTVKKEPYTDIKSVLYWLVKLEGDTNEKNYSTTVRTYCVCLIYIGVCNYKRI